MPKEYTEVSAYDSKITIKKFFKGLGMTLVPVIILYSAEFAEAETPNLPPEIAVFMPLVVALLYAGLNWWKHRDDTKKVEL